MCVRRRWTDTTGEEKGGQVCVHRDSNSYTNDWTCLHEGIRRVCTPTCAYTQFRVVVCVSARVRADTHTHTHGNTYRMNPMNVYIRRTRERPERFRFFNSSFR